MEYDAFELYLNLRYDMIVSGTNWQTITSDQLYTLCDVSAAFTTWAGVHAVGILNAHFTKNHIIPPAFKNFWSIRSSQGEVVNTNSMLVYPNPANENFLIEILDQYPSVHSISFSIYDITNKLIFKSIQPADVGPVLIYSSLWDDGVYLVKVQMDNLVPWTTKVTIIH